MSKEKPILKAIIVEDDYAFAIELEMMLKKIGYDCYEPIGESNEAMLKILESKPDLILMDIDLVGDITGIEIAKRIQPLQIPIIFITGLIDDIHYAEAEKIPLTAYITKPLELHTLKSTLSLLTKHISHLQPNISEVPEIRAEEDELFLRKGNDFVRVKHSEILYIESEHVYCKTATVNQGEFINRLKLKDFQNNLNNDKFIRPHQRFLVNRKKITMVNLNKNLIFIDNFSIPISRSAKKEIKSQLNMIS